MEKQHLNSALKGEKEKGEKDAFSFKEDLLPIFRKDFGNFKMKINSATLQWRQPFK